VIAAVVLSIAASVSSAGAVAAPPVASGAQSPQGQGVVSGSGGADSSGDVTSGSATIANINTAGWSIGMGVTIMRAGALSTLSAP
jgi:hypothetical protein